MDGEITIGTRLSTDKFDRQISDLEKKMKKEEDKKIEIEAKIKNVDTEKIDRQIQKTKEKIDKTLNAPSTLKLNADIGNLEKELQAYDIAKEKAKEYKKQLDELEKKRMEMLVANPILAGSVATGDFKQLKEDISETSKLLQQANREILQGEPKIDKVSNSLDILKAKQASITNQITEYKNTLNTLSTQKQQELNNKTEQYKKELEDINGIIAENKQKIESIQLQKQVAEVNKMKEGFNNVGSSIQNSITKVAKLALGIFGIRSAYMALRRASSDLASYDEQYATNLEYIRYALTQAVAPVLRYIVNLAATLLQYINMILNALFGINIFSRGSAESFNKMKAGASGVSKAVKEIKKQLAGFDEINMLTDQSDTGTAGGAGGVGMPSFDLSTFNMKPPKWLQWIVDNKDKVLSILTAIGGGLAFLKLATVAKNLGLIKGKLLALKAGGIAVAIYGVIEAVKGLIAFIKDPTWENFKKFLYGLATAIAGVAIAMIAFNATNPVGWILLAIGVVVALATKIADLTQKYIANKKGTLDLKNAKEALKKSEEALTEATDKYIDAVDRAEETQKALIEAERRNKMSGKELYEQVQNGTLNYRDMTEAQKEVYKAYVNNEKAQKNLEEATKEYTQAQKEHEKQSYNNQLALLLEAKKYDEFKSSVIQAYREGKISAGEARDYIEQAMKDMDKTSAQTFLQDIPNNIKEGINPDKYKGNWYNFKKKWNEFIDSLKKKIEVRFEGIFKSNVEGFSGGSHGFAKGGIVYHNLPKLGVGGIINQPGRGVPLNGAIVGERGAEGVIPLTDSQQMELLGQTIGKYIVVNANIVNTMNGRVISRELKQVQSEENFAFNT